MKVLYLVGNLNAGGLERYVTRIALRAHQGGEFEPSVVCLSKKEGVFLQPLEDAGIPVYGTPNKWARRPTELRQLRLLIKQLNPDIVHSHVNFALIQQALSVHMAGSSNLCVTERSQYQLNGWRLIRRRVQFHLLRSMGVRYSANSQAVAQHLAQQVHVSPDTIPVLANGVEHIDPDPALRHRMRSSLNWDDRTIGIGYIGRFTKIKGHHTFLHSISELIHAGLPVRACLLGDGPDRSLIERTLRDLKITNEVHLAGIVSNVEDYLQAFDIIALFSEREGMPNAIIEAMAAGKPVVATAVGAIPDLLDDGNAGIIVRDGSVRSCTSALAELVNNSDLRNKLGKLAYDRVETLFGLENIFRTLCVYYHGILTKND